MHCHVCQHLCPYFNTGTRISSLTNQGSTRTQLCAHQCWHFWPYRSRKKAHQPKCTPVSMYLIFPTSKISGDWCLGARCWLCLGRPTPNSSDCKAALATLSHPGILSSQSCNAETNIMHNMYQCIDVYLCWVWEKHSCNYSCYPRPHFPAWLCKVLRVFNDRRLKIIINNNSNSFFQCLYPTISGLNALYKHLLIFNEYNNTVDLVIDRTNINTINRPR